MNREGSPWIAGVLGAVMVLALLAQPGWARPGEKPLLLPGKESLYQKVLARPGALLRQEPRPQAPGEEAVPFAVFYVYGRDDQEGRQWLRVGVDTHGSVRGWLRADQTIEWRQALTASFREPLGHDRVLLFRDREPLRDLVAERDLAAYHRYYREARGGQAPADSPVVAIQPEAHVDLQESFYLVPILGYEEVFVGTEKARLLQVASVPLTEKGPAAKDVEYRSGVVFVMDSTLSMGPYLDRTRAAVRRVYDSLERAGLLSKASFGLVAYRDNLDAVPGLDYLARTYATLEEGLDPESFFQRVAGAQPATVSSRDFVEDAYAGVAHAIQAMDWRGYDARYVVLVTDAGARRSHDPLGATGLDAAELRQLAYDEGVAVWVLHLLTPQGSHNHAEAAAQYRALSYYPGIGNFYYGVEVGGVDEFGRVVEALAGQITREVRETAQGLPPRPIPDQASPGSPLTEFRRKVARLGYALRMRYLQEREGTQAPAVFDAWMVDRDFEDPANQTVDVRVLLTRNQLSDLQGVLRRVLETAEEGVLSPRDFLNDLKSLAASMARDPQSAAASTRTAGAQGTNLADLGYMREYLEDLPYTSDVMQVSLEDWEDWPAGRQLQFVHRLESKVNYYQALHDHTDLWTSLDGGPVTGDAVFPMVLEMLP